MKLSRRTFLKAIGLGAVALPVIAKAHPVIKKPILAKDVVVKINGEEITGFASDGLMVINESPRWSQKISDEILNDLDDVFSSLTPPQHINCRCKNEPVSIGSHDIYLDVSAHISGVCRKPGETDSELRKRISLKIKG